MPDYTAKARDREREIARRREMRGNVRNDMMAQRAQVANNAYISRMQERNAAFDQSRGNYVAAKANLYGDTIGGYQDRRQGYMNQQAARDLTAAQGYAATRGADASYLTAQSIVPVEQSRATTARAGYVAGLQQEAMRQGTVRRGQDIGVTEAEKDRTFQSGEAALNRSFQSGEADKNRALYLSRLQYEQPEARYEKVGDYLVNATTGETVFDGNRELDRLYREQFAAENPDYFGPDASASADDVAKAYRKWLDGRRSK